MKIIEFEPWPRLGATTRILDLFDNMKMLVFGNGGDAVFSPFPKTKAYRLAGMVAVDQPFPLVYHYPFGFRIPEDDFRDLMTSFVQLSSCSRFGFDSTMDDFHYLTIGCAADLAILRMLL